MADKHPTKVRVVLISTVDSILNAQGANSARIRAPSAPRPAVSIVARLVSVDYGRLRQPIRTPRRMVVFQSDLLPPRRAFGKRRTQRPPWVAPAASFAVRIAHRKPGFSKCSVCPAPSCLGSSSGVFGWGKRVAAGHHQCEPGMCRFGYRKDTWRTGGAGLKHLDVFSAQNPRVGPRD